MDFGQPNVEIGWKMANAQLLFLALCSYTKVRIPPDYCQATNLLYLNSKRKKYSNFKTLI